MPPSLLLAVIPLGEVRVKTPKLNVFCSVTKEVDGQTQAASMGRREFSKEPDPIQDAGLIQGAQEDAFGGVAIHWLALKS